MSARALAVLWIAASLTVACGVVVPAATPTPTATLEPPTMAMPTPGIGRGNISADVPACKGVANLDQPVLFEWTGIEDVQHETLERDWSYYRCGISRPSLAAFYREWMLKPPYSWQEEAWEERGDITLGVYYHLNPERWLYLWFLPDQTDKQASTLAAAWWKVRMPCG